MYALSRALSFLRLHALSTTSSLRHSCYTDRSRLAPSCARKTKSKEGGQRFEMREGGTGVACHLGAPGVDPNAGASDALRRPAVAARLVLGDVGGVGAWKGLGARGVAGAIPNKGLVAVNMRSGGVAGLFRTELRGLVTIVVGGCPVAAPVAVIAGLPLADMKGFVTMVIGGCTVPTLRKASGGRPAPPPATRPGERIEEGAAPGARTGATLLPPAVRPPRPVAAMPAIDGGRPRGGRKRKAGLTCANFSGEAETAADRRRLRRNRIAPTKRASIKPPRAATIAMSPPVLSCSAPPLALPEPSDNGCSNKSAEPVLVLLGDGEPLRECEVRWLVDGVRDVEGVGIGALDTLADEEGDACWETEGITIKVSDTEPEALPEDELLPLADELTVADDVALELTDILDERLSVREGVPDAVLVPEPS